MVGSEAPFFLFTENTYVDAAGLYVSSSTACERNMCHEFFGDGAPILTEMYLTRSQSMGKQMKVVLWLIWYNEMLPSRTKNDMKGKNKWYWEEGFKGIKYANIAISRLDGAEYKDEAERNAVLGAAYFQRAYRYVALMHQFGDVPYLDKEITEPKLDFYSTIGGASWSNVRKIWSSPINGFQRFNLADEL